MTRGYHENFVDNKDPNQRLAKQGDNRYLRPFRGRTFSDVSSDKYARSIDALPSYKMAAYPVIFRGSDSISSSDVERTLGFKKDKSVWAKWKLPYLGELRFNPVVSFIAIIIMAIFVVMCSTVKGGLPFGDWRTWTVKNFTWLYIGTENIWIVFVVWLYFSKYSNIKLGKADEEPEYSNSTWFMMLFSCGIGTGLFFFGVAEPIYHYTGANRFTADQTMPDNTLGQKIITLTFYHWGVHGWIAYCIVGMTLALLSFREGLPMTMKSCFYPLIGDKIFGWMGDAVDIISIISTLFGVCTSLGLGTRQLNSGFHMINPDLIPNDNLNVQIIIIWCITCVATISTVSGVGMGIRRLSEICFVVGMFLMCFVFFLEETVFFLNLFIQSLGNYIFDFIPLSFHTDAYEKLGNTGNADQRSRFIPEGSETADGPQNWMESWTLFYWGWWIAWCPFVGIFVARISRGRTIKQFINGTLTAPVLYTFLWIVIFGGSGIKQERIATTKHLCCADSTGWFKNIQDITNVIDKSSEMSVNDLIDENHNLQMLCEGGACGPCATQTLQRHMSMNYTYLDFEREYTIVGKDFGSVLEDRSVSKLSCHPTEQMWFDVMRTFGPLSSFLSTLSFIGIILYFVTSSDSGSLVIDTLSSNGDLEPPCIQRLFWALTEGATATALLIAGGKSGLLALQTAGILSGLPYVLLLTCICVSLTRAVKIACGDIEVEQNDFAIGLTDVFLTEPYKEQKFDRHALTLLVKCVCNIFIGPLTLASIVERLSKETREKSKTWAHRIFGFMMLIGAVIFLILDVTLLEGLWVAGLFFYLMFAILITSVRQRVRSVLDIDGCIFFDILASVFMFPMTIVQMDMSLDDEDENSNNDESEMEAQCSTSGTMTSTSPKDCQSNKHHRNGKKKTVCMLKASGGQSVSCLINNSSAASFNTSVDQEMSRL